MTPTAEVVRRPSLALSVETSAQIPENKGIFRQSSSAAHLKRDFAAHAEGLAAEKEFGEYGLALCERVFWAWEIFQHTSDRAELKQAIRQCQRESKPIIGRYASKRARNKYCRGIARNLLKAWPALWTFATHNAGSSRPTTTPSALAPQQRHLPQAQPRQPIPGRRTTDRATALRTHHLPPTAPIPARIPHRNAHRTRPRRPSTTTHISPPTN